MVALRRVNVLSNNDKMQSWYISKVGYHSFLMALLSL